MQEAERLKNSPRALQRKKEQSRHRLIVQKINDRRSYEYQHEQFNKKSKKISRPLTPKSQKEEGEQTKASKPSLDQNSYMDH